MMFTHCPSIAAYKVLLECAVQYQISMLDNNDVVLPQRYEI